MGLDAITISESGRWASLLDGFPERVVDIYFHPLYYRSWMGVHDGEAMCLYYESAGRRVLYPFFKRIINGFDLGGVYFDISTAYGYGGAISDADDDDEELRLEFADAVGGWCRENRVVAEFIREYPGATFRNTGAVDRTMVRTNLYVDTSGELENTWAGISPAARRNIRNAVSSGVVAIVDEGLDTMDDFRMLYGHTASERGFGAFYRFPGVYFDTFRDVLAGSSFIINAFEGGSIAASVLCLQGGGKLSYHLGASRRSRASLRANDLLYWEMIKESKRRGSRLLQLGGGLGLDEGDSLYRFKKKYATFETQFFIETCVHDPAVYEMLCSRWAKTYPLLMESKGSYFLRYRETC